MTAREELEAFIWQAMRAHRIDAPYPVPFVDTLLRGADKYATVQGGITAERRDVLGPRPSSNSLSQRPTWKAVHFAGTTCSRDRHRVRAPKVTTDPGKVTCGRCKQSVAWKAAAA